ncbi:pyridoxal phosphate-dependent aminotransferase [Leeia oryzae]|uniref:pyridoxal phosphate-dependent aminotransferase n=1 Tax=Leeia oryzae TaxID=356662 RepID=UPI0003A62522|nr:pyridoxal phosphate-dependent aminotransferase [Leeia oryzae]
MKFPLAERMEYIAPFQVMALLERAKQLQSAGRDIIHMEIGEPDFRTPDTIVQAGIKALQDGHTGYSPALGIPALREAISGFYASHYGVNVPASRIVVTSGASGALLLALGALVSQGSEVLLTDPGYPCNRHFVRLLEGLPVNIPVGPETKYQLTPDHLAQHWNDKTVATLVASPANPTGTLLTPAEIQALNEACLARHGRLIVDEIYQGLTYGVEAQTALALSEDLFVINSFSKYFQMTGWRLGWLVVPEAYLDAVTRLAQNIFISAPTPAQYAALAAFAPDTIQLLEERRHVFAERRNTLIPLLTELGLKVASEPEGAFYVYADCTGITDDSYQFAYRALEETGIALTPGLDFGSYRANEHIRIAYTADTHRLVEAVERLGRITRT